MTRQQDTLPGLAILASGAGSNMQAIADACASGALPARIAVVGSNRPHAGVLERAGKAGIDSVVVDHRDYPVREDFDRAMLSALQPFAPDLVVLAGFMRILTPEFVAPFRGRLLNIHPSLLPKYPGLGTHARAIAAGDREHGATVHFVTEELDGGPPVLQGKVPITDDDTADTLARRVLDVEHRIYPLAIGWYVAGRLRLAAGGATMDGEHIPASGIAYASGMA